MYRVNDIKEIGLIIRKRRKEMKLTQKDFAGLCNVGIRFVSELENGKQTLEVGKVLKLIKAVGLEINIVHRTIV